MLEKIRKFGLEYCDLPTMLWNVTVLLRVLTLNIDKRYTKRIPFIFHLVFIAIAVCYFYVYLVSVVWFVFVKCRESGDIIAAMVVISLGVSSEIGTSKLICMFFNKSLIKNLVEEYLLCDSTVIPGSRLERNIRKTLRIVKKRAMIFWTIVMSNGVVYCVTPLIMPGRHLMEDLLIIYGLEPMYESPNYEIAYCVTLFGALFTVYLPANITAFFIIITGYTEAQILALTEEIIHLWQNAEDDYRQNNPNQNADNDMEIKNQIIMEYVKTELTEILKRHTVNINLLRQVENTFRGAILIEFILLVLGLIAELLGGLENTYIEVPFALIQVAMDCLVGQRIMDAGIAFENAVYDSKWENFDVANRKTILLMLQNAQKNLTLSARGITMLRFTSLMSILNSVYSAYTTLRSTMN